MRVKLAFSPVFPLLHHHARGAEQLSVEHVAHLKNLRDEMVFFGALGGRRGHRLLRGGIERLAHRVHDLEAVAREG